MKITIQTTAKKLGELFAAQQQVGDEILAGLLTEPHTTLISLGVDEFGQIVIDENKVTITWETS